MPYVHRLSLEQSPQQDADSEVHRSPPFRLFRVRNKCSISGHSQAILRLSARFHASSVARISAVFCTIFKSKALGATSCEASNLKFKVEPAATNPLTGNQTYTVRRTPESPE